MNKFLKFFITVSIIVFLVTLLIVYAFLPDPTGILFNENGLRIHETPKGTFFYSALFLFVISQIILILFKKGVMLKTKLKFPYIITWFQGFHLSINLFIILILAFIGLANNAVDYTLSSIQFISYIAPLIVIVWLFMLPIFLLLKKS
jgi:hypothetical protein